MSSSSPRYGVVARLFHWGTVAAVAVMLPTGIAMTSEPLGFMADPLYIVHKGLGAVLLAVVFARIGWRLTHPAPPPPPAVPESQRRIMRLTHASLYALLAVMTVSGYIRTVGDDFPIELLDWMGVPPLFSAAPDAARVALVIHQFTAYTLLALVSVHVGAAVHDRLFGRTGSFERMATRVGGRASRAILNEPSSRSHPPDPTHSSPHTNDS